MTSAIETRAWNRSAERAEPLADDGVDVRESAAEAVSGAGVVITMLADGAAVESVMTDEVAGALSGDAVWAQMSTVGERYTGRFAELADERGIALIDAPVLGTKQPAENGQLIVLAAGADEAVERCDPVFGAVGARTVRLGETVGAATRMKLVLNAWLLSLTSGLAEAINLADSLDVDAEAFLDVISGGPIDSPYAQMKGGMMIARDFETSFPLSLAGKDAGLALEAGRDAGLELPLLEAVLAKFETAADMGHGEADMSAVYEASSQRDDDRPAASP